MFWGEYNNKTNDTSTNLQIKHIEQGERVVTQHKNSVQCRRCLDLYNRLFLEEQNNYIIKYELMNK